MRIAMVSEHASPLAVLGGQDAGGQNVHVAALSSALADRGHDVVVYTRRDDPDLPERTTLRPGVQVVHVPAGPASVIGKDDIAPFMPQLGHWLADDWRRHGVPDIVHAHFWMSGLATRIAIDDLSSARQAVPHDVITFHALGVVKRRHQGAADPSPADRIDVERSLLDRAEGVVATCRDEVSELLALGADPHRLHVVPCGVDLSRFTPRGPHRVPWTDGCDRLLCLGRLVERKGIDDAVLALAALPTAELVVAGGPAASQLDADPDVARLRATARRAGVRPRQGRHSPLHAAARALVGGRLASARGARYRPRALLDVRARYPDRHRRARGSAGTVAAQCDHVPRLGRRQAPAPGRRRPQPGRPRRRGTVAARAYGRGRGDVP
jgi:type III pantothenate kinase